MRRARFYRLSSRARRRDDTLSCANEYDAPTRTAVRADQRISAELSNERRGAILLQLAGQQVELDGAAEQRPQYAVGACGAADGVTAAQGVTRVGAHGLGLGVELEV